MTHFLRVWVCDQTIQYFGKLQVYGARISSSVNQVEGTNELVFHLLDMLDNQQIIFSLTLWCIIGAVEMTKFGRILKLINPQRYISQTLEFLHEWKHARKSSQVTAVSHRSIIHWTKPQNGFWKCNVDAAIFNSSNSLVHLCWCHSGPKRGLGSSPRTILYCGNEKIKKENTKYKIQTQIA